MDFLIKLSISHLPGALNMSNPGFPVSDFYEKAKIS